ncbi:flagellar basal body L-ring protein FlgH [Ramlibacter sp.]|uniref:flagellar basal body L-ring protein FlgH n=1 Tax=Ramlibacter sp. TaxID=1917967 RepID=UPI003D0C347E
MKALAVRIVSMALALAFATPLHAESLYREDTFRPLTADRKAHQPGDALTVQVVESATATSSTDVTTQRRNTLGARLTQLPSRERGFAASVNGEFEGGGSTQRSNRLLATVTVTVREVLANGDLRIAGEQVLAVNGEEHRVSLEGRVRPQDVNDGNVVASTRIADARITYVGEGELTERQKRSLWRRAMDWLGL